MELQSIIETTGAGHVGSGVLLGTPREQIGLKDRDGKEICEGDIVEFTVEYDWMERPTYDSADGTKMVDTVIVVEGRAYFWDKDVQCGGFAWRHNAHCRVTGSIHDQVPNAKAEP